MSSELNQLLDGAIEGSKQWSQKGWPMTFGKVDVNSLAEAKAMANTVSVRLEANSYWDGVDEVGQEVATHGEIAKKALADGDMTKAKFHIFRALFEERKINDQGPTWSGVFAAIDK
ncbi:hypothetical protein [Magnetococcus sp. PR-3]|uniref:hypothetical protein n=1 Tax=Magnetococcus sp. PR-3 TaxID=3120355 RepID=UPI002FCE5512